jgi:hypothetical protein
MDQRADVNETSLRDLASGQKLIILAIGINLLAIVLNYLLDELTAQLLTAAATLVGIVLAITGLLRLAGGLGYSTGMKVILIVLLFVPLVSLITLVILNSRATRILREHGYRVGLFGASKKLPSIE